MGWGAVPRGPVEREGFAKVGKRKRFRDVVLFDDLPTVHLLLQGEEFVTLERRDVLHGTAHMSWLKGRTSWR